MLQINDLAFSETASQLDCKAVMGGVERGSKVRILRKESVYAESVKIF